MLIIQDVLISDDIVEEQFICNLNACKGACCWEGDYGAPLSMEEKHLINSHLDSVKPLLDAESKDLLKEGIGTTYYKEPAFEGTRLKKNGACVFMTKNELGIAQCGLEQAYRNGDISFNKPVSCHLYPIRVIKNEAQGFEAWNYDRWDICSAACELGKKESVPIYQFLKDSIIRYKGEAFYHELDAAAQHLNK